MEQLVERPILNELLAQPGEVTRTDLGSGAGAQVGVRLDAQPLSPFRGPELAEVFAGDQVVDHLGSLVRIFRFHERVVFVLGRQHPGQVDGDTTKEVLIGTETGGMDPEFLQLLVHQLVDVVGRGRRIPFKLVGIECICILICQFASINLLSLICMDFQCSIAICHSLQKAQAR